MPKRIRDLSTGNAVQGHFVPADPTTGSTYKARLGQASGIVIMDSAGFPLDSAGRRVVESGSNSNGWFVRFSDGTQICWAGHSDSTYGATSTGQDTNYRLRSKTWVFPASFSSPPMVSHTGDVEGARVDVFNAFNVTTTQVTLEAGQYNTTTVTVSASYSVAIGRWY